MFYLQEKMFLYVNHWWKAKGVYSVNKGHGYNILAFCTLLQQVISFYSSCITYPNKVRLKIRNHKVHQEQELYESRVATGKCWHKNLQPSDGGFCDSWKDIWEAAPFSPAQDRRKTKVMRCKFFPTPRYLIKKESKGSMSCLPQFTKNSALKCQRKGSCRREERSAVSRRVQSREHACSVEAFEKKSKDINVYCIHLWVLTHIWLLNVCGAFLPLFISLSSFFLSQLT